MAKNSLAMGMVQFVSQVSTLILAMVLNIKLGKAYADYTAAFSLVTVLFLIADLGLGTKMVIDVARNREIASKKLTSILFIRGTLGFTAVVMTLAFVVFSKPPSEAAFAYIIVALSTALGWMAQTFTSMFTAFEKMYYVFMTYLVERMFTVPVSIALVYLGYGLETVVLVLLIGNILYVALSYVVCTRLIVQPSRELNLKDVKNDLKGCAPFAINVALVSTLYSINAFLLLSIVWGMADYDAGAAASNTYTIAFGLVAALIAVPTVFRTALLPVITRLFGSSKEMTKLAQQKIMKYMYSLGLPMTLGGMVLADEIINLLFPGHPESAVVLQILLPVLAISYFGTGQGSLLAAADLMHLSTISSVAGAVTNLAICFLAIPIWGPSGAALAFTAATLVTNVISHYYMSRRVVHLRVTDIILKPTMAGAGMTLVLLIIPGNNLFLSIVVGMVAYFGLLYLLKAIDQDDIDIFRKALKKGA
ncbi:MAG: polysaccharide biosynthesis C-terminal domain-containing protein [Methanomassiliicoccus sp.]|nr:polysaccharide biosynthesis C-terminal domain-containing protein [Methanomassiliicoccus sp.]